MKNTRSAPITASIFALLLLTTGCQSAYYGLLEKVGIHKRDILISRVEKAKGAQEETKKQFDSALEAYMAVVRTDSSKLQDRYEQFRSEYETSEAKAEQLEKRIEAVENVSEALFEEWESELKLYQSPKLRRQSQEQLNQARARYKSLKNEMRQSHAQVKPILLLLRDRVLYLKHNLNAQALGAMKGELTTLQTEIKKLKEEMDESITESQEFIDSLKNP